MPKTARFQTRQNDRARGDRDKVEARETVKFAKALSGYFADEAQRVARSFVSRGILTEEEVKEAASKADFDFSFLDWDAEDRELRKIVTKQYINIAGTAFANVSRALGVEVAFDLNARSSKVMLNAVGALVKGINAGSRDRLQSIVLTGINNGDSPAAIAREMLGSVSGWAGLEDLTASRATTIARTETANAYTAASVQAYRDSDIVPGVICLDSPDCGWDGHDDSELADGTERSFDEAESQPLSHPNCVRAFAPIVAGAPAEPTQ